MDPLPAATLNRRPPPKLSHCPQLSCRFLALLIVSFVALSEVMVYLPQQGEVTPNANLTSQLLRDNGSSGSTGERFSGNKVRTYRGRHFQFQEVASHQQQQSIFGPDLTPNCVKWAVVTTIHEPDESIFGVSKLKNWCLVIVGDTITPLAKYEELAMEEGVFFLSASYQTQHLASNPFISIMPFKSFARKNVGYLFAVTYGAKVIYDFDDDNILQSLEDNVTVPPPFFYREDVGFDKTTLLHFVESGEQSKDSPAFNPYEFMGASHKYSWPRGFPIDSLQKNFETWGQMHKLGVGDMKYSSIGVIQSLCDGDPDNDAVFRMTRPDSTNFSFDHTATSLPLLIPFKKYTPYNAQATTHLYNSFWGLYLPISVPGRVTDIWRSYITQRIMKDVGLHVVYTPPIVKHERSDHDYLADFEAEHNLYGKTTALLKFLDSWTSAAKTLPEKLSDLWIALYEHDFIGLLDVTAMEEWIKFLLGIGYEFPIPNTGELGEQEASARVQPSVEGQPYRSYPMLEKNGRTSKVLKIIMMTMDEWPLMKSWVLYHGYLVGFENLYILDGSSKIQCTALLRYARDSLGANVIFTNANLNQLQSVMTSIAKDIAGASDYIIKMDTDEFLVAYNDSTKTLTTSISDLLDGLTLEGDSRVGYIQASVPSKDVCRKDKYSTPEKFPLGEVQFIGNNHPSSYFKAVFDSKLPFGSGGGGRTINLGGHAHAVKAGRWTNFGVVHYHSRCVEIEVENCKRVLVSHGYILPSDSDENVITKLAGRFDCSTNDVCNSCAMSKSFASNHKARFYLQWLVCREKTTAEYYQSDKKEQHQNADNVVETMQVSHEIFDL